MTDYNAGHYAEFNEKKEKLTCLLNEAAEMISELGMSTFSDVTEKLCKKVHNESFKIQVIGTFKNGKSTFINSFLGEEILPAYALPCTAVINEVKYGPDKKAILHFKNPLPERLPEELSELSVNHIKEHNQGIIPPLEIPYDEIEDYVVIPIGKDPKEMLLESPYEKVELFWPLELLKNGVEIIDSPGLNEHSTRTRVTMDYLDKADAVIFVLSATSLCSREEMDFLEHNLKARGFDDTFFVVNRFDLIPERERKSIVDYAGAKLSPYFPEGGRKIHFVSAINALDGKLDNDTALIESSEMPAFEKCLSDFLLREKGQAKLSQPAREIMKILKEEAVGKTISYHKHLLGESLEAVKHRCESAMPDLSVINLRKEQFSTKLYLMIQQLEGEVRRFIYNNFLTQTDNIAKWVGECPVSVKIGALPTKEKFSAIASEIIEYVSENLERYYSSWHRFAFVPFIKEKAEAIFSAVEKDLEKFYEDIDNIRADVAGKSDFRYSDSRAWSRITEKLRSSAGYVGDNGAGVEILSGKLTRSLSASLGATMLLTVFNLWNPVGISMALVGIFVYGSFNDENSAVTRIKEAVCAELAGKFRANENTAVDGATGEVTAAFESLVSGIVSVFDNEIVQTELQIKNILREMEKGEENIARQMNELDSKKERISSICDGLTAIITSH